MPGPFAWFFGAPFIYPRSVDAGDADNHRKGPFVSEELADLKDSLAPINDQLKLNWFWWIPEILPFRQRYQEVDKKPQLCPVRKINLGFGRKIPKGHEGDPVYVHRSVKMRMDAGFHNGKEYTPRVFKGRVEWVNGKPKVVNFDVAH